MGCSLNWRADLIQRLPKSPQPFFGLPEPPGSRRLVLVASSFLQQPPPPPRRRPRSPPPAHPSGQTQPLVSEFSKGIWGRGGRCFRPCEAARIGMDEGAPATSPIPTVDPGLHGSSSRISPCARLIPAAEPTPGSRSQAGGGGGTRAERKHAKRGGAPREVGPGNRLIRSLFFDLSGAVVYPGAGRRRPRPLGPGSRGRGEHSET